MLSFVITGQTYNFVYKRTNSDHYDYRMKGHELLEISQWINYVQPTLTNTVIQFPGHHISEKMLFTVKENKIGLHIVH